MDEWRRVAKGNNINASTFRYRVEKMGWPRVKAATTPVMTKAEVREYALKKRDELMEKEQERIYNDPDNLFAITPLHIEDAAKNGINKNTVQGRVYNSGWTVEEAITIPVEKKNSDKNSEEYKEYQAVAIKNGISKRMFTDRVGKLGWTFEKASGTPRLANDKRVREDAEWIDKALQSGIKYHTYIKRVRRGWTPEEAATTQVLSDGQYLNEERAERSRKAFKEFRNVKG